MLEAVSAPLRAYLKGRADTVRQIVTSLTDPEASELLEVDGGEDGAELLQEDVPDEECVDMRRHSDIFSEIVPASLTVHLFFLRRTNTQIIEIIKPST